MHLPELETRDGITLVMEDIVTSRTWNMRYRCHFLLILREILT